MTGVNILTAMAEGTRATRANAAAEPNIVFLNESVGGGLERGLRCRRLVVLVWVESIYTGNSRDQLGGCPRICDDSSRESSCERGCLRLEAIRVKRVRERKRGGLKAPQLHCSDDDGDEYNGDETRKDTRGRRGKPLRQRPPGGTGAQEGRGAPRACPVGVCQPARRVS